MIFVLIVQFSIFLSNNLTACNAHLLPNLDKKLAEVGTVQSNTTKRLGNL